MGGTQEQKPLTITVEAKDLSAGDFVVSRGLVDKVENNGMFVVFFDNDVEIYAGDEPVEVRLEDNGEDK